MKIEKDEKGLKINNDYVLLFDVVDRDGNLYAKNCISENDLAENTPKTKLQNKKSQFTLRDVEEKALHSSIIMAYLYGCRSGLMSWEESLIGMVLALFDENQKLQAEAIRILQMKPCSDLECEMKRKEILNKS